MESVTEDGQSQHDRTGEQVLLDCEPNTEPLMQADLPIMKDNINDDDNDDDDELGVAVDLPPIVGGKKKKKKRKPQSQRGLGKPTGFEEFYADAPKTPEQYAEDQEMYSSNLSFNHRVLTAIQRFERTRKLSPERRDIFYKYLAYGGVDVGPNMFQGGQDTSEMDKDQLAQALAQTSISSDKDNLDAPDAKYVVDFVGCLKGFLSRRAMMIYGFGTEDSVKLVTTTLERFFDYLLQHEVCPEYETEILEARSFCRTATAELWSMAQVSLQLLGDFNVACSTLFGEDHAQNHSNGMDWLSDGPLQASGKEPMSPETATQVVHFAVAGAATEEVYRSYLSYVAAARDSALSPPTSISNSNTAPKLLEIVKSLPQTGFEVTKIISPTKACIDLYKKSLSLQPMGRVHARPWLNPDSPPEDLTAEEKIALAGINSSQKSSLLQERRPDEDEYILFLPHTIQQNLRIGTKLEATIHKLNCGIWYFDEFLRIFPSFDTYLPNELMVGWKEPRAVAGPHGWPPVPEPALLSPPVEAAEEIIMEDETVADQSDGGDGGADGQMHAETPTNRASHDLNDEGNGNDSDIAVNEYATTETTS